MMFDINGGAENVFVFLIWSMTFIFFTLIPMVSAMSFMDEPWYKKYYAAIAFAIGFALWFGMLYVCHPSLTLWKVS